MLFCLYALAEGCNSTHAHEEHGENYEIGENGEELVIHQRKSEMKY